MHNIHALLQVFDSISKATPSLYREFFDATLRQSSESSLPGSGSPVPGGPSSAPPESYRKPVTPKTPSVGIHTESSSPPRVPSPLLRYTASFKLSSPLKTWHRGSWSGIHAGDTSILVIDLFNNFHDADPGTLASVVASEMTVYDVVCLLVHAQNKGIRRFVPRGCTVGTCTSGDEAVAFLRCILGAVE